MKRLLCVLLLLVACADPSSFEEDVRVSTTVSPSLFRSGDKVTVTTKVSNNGRRSWRFGAETDCGDLYQVLLPDGSFYSPPGFRCLKAGIATIEPGQQM